MTTLSLREVADTLVKLCNGNDTDTGLKTLYADNAVSVEAAPGPGQDSAETIGLEGIKGKHDWWNSSFEVHSSSAEGPYLHGENRFAVIFKFDATEKQSGQRWQMTEVGIYTVESGKIVREEFFYTMDA